VVHMLNAIQFSPPGEILSLANFETRCLPFAVDLEDRLCRYISSQQEWDLSTPTLWPLFHRAFFLRFPWEC